MKRPVRRARANTSAAPIYGVAFNNRLSGMALGFSPLMDTADPTPTARIRRVIPTSGASHIVIASLS
jgi:hypothetical protein